MPTRISPMLSVSDATTAIEFYKVAFAAEVRWEIEGAVAGLVIDGAPVFLAEESPSHGNRAPSAAGFTTVRIELFVDDPSAVYDRALAAGATVHSPMQEHRYEMTGPQPIHRMLQGGVRDPFGHVWLVGKILD